ncbi:MAG: hypothetical protein AB1Z98_30210 [Nannocystaceae bacterium]
MGSAGVANITCAGEHVDDAEPGPESDGGPRIRYVAMAPRLRFDELVAWLDALGVARARAVIVLPRTEASDPDSLSRLVCAAIRKVCGDRSGPNVLVEVEDPEAAFEFVGLGVATVFYSGHLRAALLGQASVDLGVFQFIVGLLRGRHQIRTIDVPPQLRDKTFADAAVQLELDEHGRPMTVIGVAGSSEDGGRVVTNPGPRTPLRDVLGLLVLITADETAQEAPAP